MSIKKVLIWDDLQREAEKVRNLLVPIKKANDWEIDVDVLYNKYTEFQSYLEENHETYDLLIMDCLQGKDNNVAEVALRMLKTLNSELKVIVITGYQPPSFEKLPDIYGRNKCCAVLKTLFQSETDPNRMELVIAKILDLNICHRGIYEKINLRLEPENDLYLKYLVELIGGENRVKEIIYEIIDRDFLKANTDTSQFILNALSQGLSGATVFNLETINSNNDSVFRFIKLSMNKGSMSNELSKARSEYFEIKPNYRISYLTPEPISFNDYHIIVAELVESSISLRKKIVADSEGDLSVKIINELLTKCLAELYHKQSAQYTVEPIVHSILKVFNTKRLAFLTASNDELKCLIGEHDIIKKIEKLQKRIDKESIFYEKKNFKKTLVHGDLHSNNIIVSKDNHPFIIDPANMGRDHWSRDICMLIIDIFAYGIDEGIGEYFGTTEKDKWIEMGKNMIKNTEIENSGNNKGVVASINWLTNVDNLRNIFKDFFDLWEFQMSLGVEFLRASYKQDTLPAGKRAACLSIGIEAIKTAEEILKNP